MNAFMKAVLVRMKERAEQKKKAFRKEIKRGLADWTDLPVKQLSKPRKVQIPFKQRPGDSGRLPHRDHRGTRCKEHTHKVTGLIIGAV